ncbi:MAG TPA: hypothetical protein ENN57_02045 [Chloroflexi bacterium]|nr:hypothetical protein [Chloroflexota bacterium]
MKKWSKKVFSSSIVFILLIMLTSLAIPSLAMAQESERDFVISSDYTHIVIGKGTAVELDVKVTNLGKANEDVALSISGPTDWGARIERRWNKYEVRAVRLSSEEGANSVELRFKAKPPQETAKGDYLFTLEGATTDGRIQRSLDITITYKEEAVSEETEIIKLTSKNPSLEQPAGKEFEFEIELKNGFDEERIFDLAAQVPYRWAAYVTPRWEKEKRITATKVNANGTETIRLVLTPPFDVEKGDYSATLEARGGDDAGSIDLKATVTGTYMLKMGSEAEVLGTGETRNIKATAGKDKLVTIYLWNEGSAAISDIAFFSSKPKDWEVTFEPDKMPSLNPVTKEFKPDKVEVTIRPKSKAIPGDYTVTLTASGKEAREQLGLRVTVVTPMTWGWVGIGIVVVVIAALVGIFVRLGRR